MTAEPLALADSAVPGVALIGDAAALRDRLAAAGERLVDRSYLRYKPGTSLIAAIGLDSGPAFAYAVSEAARPKLAKLVDRAPRGSLLWHSSADLVLVARPAADRDLPALEEPGRLAALLPGHGESTQRWTTLAYKPQRRWVGRAVDCSSAGTSYLVRAYRPSDLASVCVGWQLADRVADLQPGVRLPSVHSTSARRGTAAVTWLPGQPLDRLMATGAVMLETLQAVGAGLARVHDALSRPGDGRVVATRLRAAEAVVRELGELLPDHRWCGARLVRRLTVLAPPSGRVSPIHGDFSTDQVIIGPDGSVGFADWDRAGWGDPAVDLGGLRAAGLPESAYGAVLDGYRTVRAVPSSTGWHAALAGALRLTEPLRTCRADWRSEIVDRLDLLQRQVDALAAGHRECA